MGKNPTQEKQLELAIEHLALSYEYVFQRQEMTLSELAFFLDDLQMEYGRITDESQRRAAPESNFKNYRKQLRKSEFSVDYDYRGLGFSGLDNMEKVSRMCAFYVGRFCINFEQDAHEIFIKNISQNGQYPLRPIWYLVLIKYAVKFRLPFFFTYHKMNSSDISDRKIIPYALAMRENYIDLIGKDNDGLDKQFIISRIKKIKTDLYQAWNDYQANLYEGRKSEFHYNEYLSTPEGSFQREAKTYRLRLFVHSYDHFCHTYNIDHHIVAEQSESEYDVDIEFKSVNHRLVRMIVFNYGKYCRLLAPPDEADKYRSLIYEQYKHYEA